ncbi:hypothetical protein ROHU_001110 [Labeo rohita]|uniref:Uncharacterized protein n=1 Tax=Labeo rohita TaxID=84645 RepID=A0A498P3E0_LABRO|nr:hypothetical protein ROHU_029460 [Labeo rohita]RXN38436.1 hypothetical protein ROHU_001110 [Labeo rohita]
MTQKNKADPVSQETMDASMKHEDWGELVEQEAEGKSGEPVRNLEEFVEMKGLVTCTERGAIEAGQKEQ